jgi:hypothetical protein
MRVVFTMTLALGLIACSGLMPKRDFIDHTFYATSPKLAIRLSDDFILDDKDESNSFNFFSSGGESGTNVREENFQFINPEQKKAFTLSISKINRGFWRSDLLDGIEHPLKTSVMRAYERDYQSAVFVTRTDDGSCLLVRYIGAHANANHQTLVNAYYLQEIPPRLGGCEDWKDVDRLNSRQRAFLSRFLEDFAEEIKFVDPNKSS